MRDELLNRHWWRSVAEARSGRLGYREDFNEVRPHGTLDHQTPREFARRHEQP
jgi:putative transposase